MVVDLYKKLIILRFFSEKSGLSLITKKYTILTVYFSENIFITCVFAQFIESPF